MVALRIPVGDLLRVLHFLGSAGGQVATPGIGLKQDLVGDHVQLFLCLTLHIDALLTIAASHAQHVAQRALAGGYRDALARARHHLDQQREFGVAMVGAAFLDQELGQRDGLHVGSMADETGIVPAVPERRHPCAPC